MFLFSKKPLFLAILMLFSFGLVFNCCCAKKVKKAELIEEKYKKIVDEYKKIKVADIVLDNKNIKNSEFLFGVATSSYQVEGHDGASTDKTADKYCHWLGYVGKKITIEVGDKQEVKTISDPGVACEHYKRYKQDIKLIKNLGCNAYRFSISWGKVNPKEGVFNEAALKHYEDVCKELKKNGIRPVITLYHYAHPMWFENKSAFEKPENTKYFVDYSMKVFERLNKYNPIWFTINTFTGTSLHAYYMGTKPPFKKDMGLALKVLKNLLQAHVEFYRKAKKSEKEPVSTIGIYKIICPIDKYRSWQLWDSIGVSFVEKLNNNCIYDFFTKGILDVNIGIPVLSVKNSIYYKNKDAIGALDCVGLNYYFGAYMSNFKVMPRLECLPTQSSLARVYPEGFYSSLKQVNNKLAKKLNIPIYVTENGIATNSPEFRDAFYRSHLNVLSKAISEGMDIRGYINWSLFDCFDWLEGYDFEYGIYSVDRKTLERKLKPGIEFFTDVIKAHNKELNKKVVAKSANIGDMTFGDLKKDIKISQVKNSHAKEANLRANNKGNILEQDIFGSQLGSELDSKFNNNFGESIKVTQNLTYSQGSCLS